MHLIDVNPTISSEIELRIAFCRQKVGPRDRILCEHQEVSDATLMNVFATLVLGLLIAALAASLLLWPLMAYTVIFAADNPGDRGREVIALIYAVWGYPVMPLVSFLLLWTGSRKSWSTWKTAGAVAGPPALWAAVVAVILLRALR